MSNFYGTVTSSTYKTVASRRGHGDIAAHIRGWDSGVTSGSGVRGRDLFLGTVVLKNNETRFIPGNYIDEIITK